MTKEKELAAREDAIKNAPAPAQEVKEEKPAAARKTKEEKDAPASTK